MTEATKTTANNAPQHIVNAIREGRVTEITARPYPRLLALVRELTGKAAAVRRPRQHAIVWLHPSQKWQRFRVKETGQTGVVASWDRSRVTYFLADEPNAVRSVRRDEFSESFAEWMPGLHYWPKPSARSLEGAPKIPASLVQSIAPAKEAA